MKTTILTLATIGLLFTSCTKEDIAPVCNSESKTIAAVYCSDWQNLVLQNGVDDYSITIVIDIVNDCQAYSQEDRIVQATTIDILNWRVEGSMDNLPNLNYDWIPAHFGFNVGDKIN